MAYAPDDVQISDITGSFIERQYGKTFEYTDNPEFVLHVPAHGGKLVHFPHLVYVGPPGATQTRRALVKGIVAHVVTDETEFGFVTEKWHIAKHRIYKKGA